MSTPEIGLAIGVALNIFLSGVAWGTMRQQLKTMPQVINGTAVRPHENRCQNYNQHPDNTSPGI